MKREKMYRGKGRKNAGRGRGGRRGGYGRNVRNGHGRLGFTGVIALMLVLLFSGAVREPRESYGQQEDTHTEKLAEDGGTGEGTLLEVHFIDVGQADATLLLCDDAAMLIDAGDTDDGTALQYYLEKQGVSRLDYLILTHPDADHIGGAPVVITKFPIDTVMMSYMEKDNRVYEKLMQALEEQAVEYMTPMVGETYSLGAAEFTIIAPNAQYEDPNNASVGVLVRNGENSFLFTGDAEQKAEEDILQNEISVEADVYKVGHHGSSTSSAAEFLDAVAPKYAVISCGEDNAYGHPHSEVLNSLRARGVLVYRTDEQGSIIAVSDGKQITWSCSPTETWQTGR